MNKSIVPFTQKGRKLAASIVLAGLYFSPSQAFSQDTTELEEVVVTGTKFEIPVEKSGKSIYKLDQEAIEQNAGKTVADLLNEVPGIQIEGNFGSPGTNINYFVRGASSKNTLILIDGVPINDPSGIASTYDLRLLSLDQVASIEVLKGGLSTLYGTGASAAVISIKLKSGQEDKSLAGSVDINGGSFGTYRGGLNLNGKSNKFNYMLSGSTYLSDGFSSASEEQSPTPFGKDGMKRQNALLKLGYAISDRFRVDFVSAFDDMEADYDDNTFTDADNQQISQQFRFGLSPSYTYSKGSIKLKSIYNINEREFISSFPSEYKGRNLQLDLTQEHQILNGLKGLWGVNLQQLSYEQPGELDFDENKFTLVDPYASLFYESNAGFNIHGGIRLNTHSEYDSKLVYNLNPSYLTAISDKVSMKILASVSSSYVTPTLYQLNSPLYGNEGLQPEESINYEQGVSFYIGQDFTINLVHFTRDESDPIDFVSIYDDEGNYVRGEYQNTTNERRVEGFEADFSWKVNQFFELNGNYAHVSTDKPETFYRIPKNKWGMTFMAKPTDNTVVSLKYNFTSKRTIYDWGYGGELELDSYGLIDLYAQQSVLNKKLKLYAGINNLLDEEFTAIYGYTTRGRNFNIGAKYQF
ncbi:TonB-dependent receptor plug domain-containing protein [Echinicola salinicaeni]|uniref:TonB-dependent receptor plug domain-containing protein n=1 Tax=Echinicola salinicaeni TaxID=2762757 RepID=UPI0016464322|nr:TonB-dependent receptor plug domain-containing protein [Echinicola salinicaeni]